MLVDYANSCFIIIGQKVFPDRQYKKSINNDLQNTAQKTKKRSFCHDLFSVFFLFQTNLSFLFEFVAIFIDVSTCLKTNELKIILC
jgi:hypothetical protein